MLMNWKEGSGSEGVLGVAFEVLKYSLLWVSTKRGIHSSVARKGAFLLETCLALCLVLCLVVK